MRWRHEAIEGATWANGLRCLEAANALIRVHKASTQNQNLRSKTSRISMSQRDNCKSCHSDQLSHPINSVRGMLWGTKTKKPVFSFRTTEWIAGNCSAVTVS